MFKKSEREENKDRKQLVYKFLRTCYKAVQLLNLNIAIGNDNRIRSFEK